MNFKILKMFKFKLVATFMFLIPPYIYAQKWESIAKLNSGLFHFIGPGSSGNSVIYDFGDQSYTDNPYGTSNGIAYGLGFNVQRVTSYHFVYGFDFDFESLQSKAPIDYTDVNSKHWRGRTYLRANFLTVSPHLGFLFGFKNFKFDLKGAFEFALPLAQAKEDGKAISSDGQIVTSDEKRDLPPIDFRNSVTLTVFKHKYGLGVGYAYGFMDYKLGWVGGTNLVFSRYLKISLQHQLSKKPKQ